MLPCEARAKALACGFAPLTDWPGDPDDSRQWRCRCTRCDAVGYPTQAAIRSGRANCRTCARRTGGVPPTRPAEVYVVHHDGLGAVKVGICASGSPRIAGHRRQGWALVGALALNTGEQAWQIEQAVLTHVRQQLSLGPFPVPAGIRRSGWTETFSAERLPADRLWELVRHAPARLAERAAQRADKDGERARSLEAAVRDAARDAEAVRPPVDGDVLDCRQLYALFGRTGVLWDRARVTARYVEGEVRLSIGSVMVGAVAVDPCAWTVVGPYRVLLIKDPYSGRYAEAPLSDGALPDSPRAERARRIPAPPRAVR